MNVAQSNRIRDELLPLYAERLLQLLRIHAETATEECCSCRHSFKLIDLNTNYSTGELKCDHCSGVRRTL